MFKPVTALARLVNVLVPPRCVVCGEPGDDPDGLCAACFDALPWNTRPCPRCALPLPDPVTAPAAGPDPEPVPACACAIGPNALLDRVHAPLRYEFPVTRLVPRLKFHGDLAAGRQLSAMMCLAFRDLPAPDALVPVPLHRRRLGQRGYDQALELARPLARGLGIPLQTGLLRRVRATVPQTELRARSRRRNLRDAFRVTGPVPAHVALVDDVMTTGSTLGECAAVLREAGAERVEAWVLARAVAPAR